ncbi:MAG: phytanoyl-CoA dioxygenase family protein [Armatimonadota bacterium]
MPLDSLNRVGAVVISGVLNAAQVRELLAVVDGLEAAPAVRRRAGETYAVRDLLARAPAVRELGESPAVRALVEPLLGPDALLVRAILFDKRPGANWTVAWHQDRTIEVQERREVPGFGPWTVKAGVQHVQPPAEVLERMLAVRLHLSDCPPGNGALRVLPGSHRHGLLSQAEIREWAAGGESLPLPARAGDALLMRPLVLHASSPAVTATRRPVIHLEYAAGPLPGGLRWRVGAPNRD